MECAVIRFMFPEERILWLREINRNRVPSEKKGEGKSDERRMVVW